MTRPTRLRNQWTRWLAALLLVLQGLAGGAVSLAHATERISAPIHIEGQHAASCAVLHEEGRCALCHLAGSLWLAPAVRTRAPLAATPQRTRLGQAIPRKRRAGIRTAPPRAPPPSRS